MKSTRAIVMILLSLLAGAVAVILAARWVGQQAAQNTTPVVVASRNLEQGTPLTAVMLQEVPWPAGNVPVGAFTEMKKLEGRIARSPVFKGEPILDAKLAPEGSTGGLSSSIPSGKRAISVKVNEVVGVAGFALPGSFVDIMVNIMDSKQKSVSKIILKRILVLAVAQEASRDETKPKVVSAVTLEVTPEEAEKIDLARSIGSLSLVLRNPIDRNEMETVGVHGEDLLGKDKVPPVPQAAASAATPARPVSKARAKPVAASRPAPSNPASVEVIRGLQKANSEF